MDNTTANWRSSAGLFERYAGEWAVLSGRLDRRRALAEWGSADPVLAGIGTADGLRAATAPHADRARAQAVITALVRIAAVDGGNDADAALVVVHLLRPLVARKVSGHGRDHAAVTGMLVAELAMVIRGFPWRRVQPTPTRLVLDAWHRVWRELRPHSADEAAKSVTVDPASLAEWGERQSVAVTVTQPAGCEDAADELADLLVWAAQSGVLESSDAILLWDLARAGAVHGRNAARSVAVARGVAACTVRRRRQDAIEVLRGARDRFFAAA